MSGAPIISGICQFAKPTSAGMNAPNIMIRPCSVVSSLKSSGCTICRPGWNSSARIVSAMRPPTMNIAKLKNRYSVPMSLWFVDVSQRRMPFGLIQARGVVGERERRVHVVLLASWFR